jgi:hypothetical protein
MGMIQLGSKNSSRRKGKRMDKIGKTLRGRRPSGLVVHREKPLKRLISSQVFGPLKVLTLKTIRECLAGRSRLSLDFLSHGKI